MEPDATDPGPIDVSVLYDQENHVSSAIWNGQERGVLRCHEHTSKLGEWRLTQKQIELVEKAGFGYLRLLPSISLDNPLISALVERWRKETNTFQMTVGEMTTTLEDVALLLGLAVDGEPVLGVTYTSCKSVCERFLGKVPEVGYKSGGMVKLSWLKEYFSQCPEDASLEEIECHTRAYLLYLVGSTIFSTTTGNKVPVMYLPLFEDFEKAGKYAWGAAALAFLYRSLGKASLISQNTISGCLTLLQCWSYFHLNIGRPNFYQEPVQDCFPFVLRWKGKQRAATVKGDIVFYRKALDSLEARDVEWRPYKNMDSALIPENIRSNLILGRSKTMLICFDKAERHLPDRCLRQHGLLQGIPESVQQWERKSRGVDSGINLSGKMESELREWSARRFHIVQGDDGVNENEYMHWYSIITRKFIGRPVSPLSQSQGTVKFRTKKKRMNAGLRDIAHIADTFSTVGLDPQQIESISKIRAIAHACLGDQVGCETIISSTLEVGLGKKSREKEQVRRNTNGKHKQKDDSLQCHTTGEDDQAQLYGAVVVTDQMQLCHADSDIDKSQPLIENSHSKLGKKEGMKKKERTRRKTSRKRKRNDDPVQECDAANEDVHSLFGRADLKDDQIHISYGDGSDDQLLKDDRIHLFHTDGNNDLPQLLHPVGEVENLQLCNADGEVDHSQTWHVAGESGGAVSYHTAGEGQKAQSFHASNNVDSKLSDASHEVGDSNLSHFAGENDPRTAKTAAEVAPESSLETSQDVEQKIDTSVPLLTENQSFS